MKVYNKITTFLRWFILAFIIYQAATRTADVDTYHRLFYIRFVSGCYPTILPVCVIFMVLLLLHYF